MPDKKLTNKEIVKALECCCNEGYPLGCEKCPYNDLNCNEDFDADVLDLINRLQAENERLQEAIDEQDIEISRLYKRIDEAKAEAYKECIEKVMSKSTYNPMGMFYIVPEEWLKELVGDNK